MTVSGASTLTVLGSFTLSYKNSISCIFADLLSFDIFVFPIHSVSIQNPKSYQSNNFLNDEKTQMSIEAESCLTNLIGFIWKGLAMRG
jgi:hypothetical protein